MVVSTAAAGVSISCATSSWWEAMATWLVGFSMVVTPMRGGELHPDAAERWDDANGLLADQRHRWGWGNPAGSLQAKRDCLSFTLWGMCCR